MCKCVYKLLGRGAVEESVTYKSTVLCVKRAKEGSKNLSSSSQFAIIYDTHTRTHRTSTIWIELHHELAKIGSQPVIREDFMA